MPLPLPAAAAAAAPVASPYVPAVLPTGAHAVSSLAFAPITMLECPAPALKRIVSLAGEVIHGDVNNGQCGSRPMVSPVVTPAHRDADVPTGTAGADPEAAVDAGSFALPSTSAVHARSKRLRTGPSTFADSDRAATTVAVPSRAVTAQ